MAKQKKNEQQKREEEFLKIYDSGKITLQEAAEKVGRSKSWGSRIAKKSQQSKNVPATTDEPKQKIKESRTPQEEVIKVLVKKESPAPQKEVIKVPVKEESAKVVEAPQMPQIASKMHEPIKSTPTEEKAEEEPNTKPRKQVFSFRASIDDIAIWRSYATATGMSLEKFANSALQEYVENHSLTGTEQVIFEALKARNSK